MIVERHLDVYDGQAAWRIETAMDCPVEQQYGRRRRMEIQNVRVWCVAAGEWLPYYACYDEYGQE